MVFLLLSTFLVVLVFDRFAGFDFGNHVLEFIHHIVDDLLVFGVDDRFRFQFVFEHFLAERSDVKFVSNRDQLTRTEGSFGLAKAGHRALRNPTSDSCRD